jgi:hypothetical protein
MSGSVSEALRKAAVEALRKATNKTLPWSQLLQREGIIRQAVKKEVAEAITWLVETGRVAITSGIIPGPKCSFRLLD